MSYNHRLQAGPPASTHHWTETTRRVLAVLHGVDEKENRHGPCDSGAGGFESGLDARGGRPLSSDGSTIESHESDAVLPVLPLQRTGAVMGEAARQDDVRCGTDLLSVTVRTDCLPAAEPGSAVTDKGRPFTEPGQDRPSPPVA
jgi:hypothetical protein